MADSNMMELLSHVMFGQIVAGGRLMGGGCRSELLS
jgi:hypothetical protein